MPFDLPYGTLLSYSPRSDSELAQKAKLVCGRIKSGDPAFIKSAIEKLSEPPCSALRSVLGNDVTLVPVPRSAPLVQGAVWPSKIIADLLVHYGYGEQTMTLINRVSAVPKSSSSAPENRPSVEQHYQSLEVLAGDLFSPPKIALVDDVLTQGRTTIACARRLMEVYHAAEIKVFAMVRTLGFTELNQIVDPAVSKIKYYASGKTFRCDPD